MKKLANDLLKIIYFLNQGFMQLDNFYPNMEVFSLGEDTFVMFSFSSDNMNFGHNIWDTQHQIS